MPARLVIAGLAVAAATTFADAHSLNGHRHHHGEIHATQPGHAFVHGQAGIAVAAEATALLALAAAAKAHEHKPVYAYHHGRTSGQNAAAACLHRAYWATIDAGGHGVTLRKLYYVNATANGFRVSIGVKRRVPGGSALTRATCTITGNAVTGFRWG